MRSNEGSIENIIECINIISTKYPNSVAIIEEETNLSFTYNELMTKSSEISLELIKHIQYPKEIIVGDETPLVALLTNRGHASIASMLGILKAGAAYVPIDPSFPEDRQLHILTHSKCQIVIVEDIHLNRLKNMNTSYIEPLPTILILNASNASVIELKSDSSAASNILNKSLSIGITKSTESLAYVLYTSGSTGKPKGVMVRNQGLHNIIQFFANDLQVTHKDTVLGLTTFCFDISMLEIFLPLIKGATLVLVSIATQKNPIKIIEALKKYNITIMQATPTTYEMLISCGWNGDKNIKFLVGGEACRPKVAQLSSVCGGLYNVYGPTETTIWSSSFRIPTDKDIVNGYVTSGVPVGHPISATSFYLVSEKGEEITDKDGEGELFIGGDGVALGYLHASDLTVARFIKNPFGHGRVYRTGDLFRRIPEDGSYVFVRRLDDQVKVAGFRIELAEVEFGISSHPDVKQAVVIVKDDSLIAFIALNSNHHSSLDDPSELFNSITKHAKKSLPHYMIPKIVQAIKEFPQTANGKLDKLSLAAMIDTTNSNNNSNNLSNLSTATTAILELVNLDKNSLLLNINKESISEGYSMAAFLIQSIKKINNQNATLYSTFAAVGVDSLAALIFKNFLSQSLGGIYIDIGLLYDPDTTIASFANILYEKANSENPKILEKLHITCAIDKLQEDDIESKRSKHNMNDTDSLARLILFNRPLVDGYRGFAMLLILIQHLTTHKSYYTYIAVDEKLFIMMTGFMIGLQELLAIENNNSSEEIVMEEISTTSNSTKFNAVSWLKSRAIGLFPLYWIAIILNAPVINIDVAPDYSQSELVGFMFLNITALQEWSENWRNLLNLYYISLIWSIFLIYASYKKVFLSTLHTSFKVLGTCVITLFLVLMDKYLNHFTPNSTKVIFNPSWGFLYFCFGFLASILCSILYKSSFMKIFYTKYCTIKSEIIINDQYNIHLSNLVTNNSNQFQDKTTTTITASSNKCMDTYFKYKNILSQFTDVLGFLLIFLIFTSPGSNGNENDIISRVMVFLILPFIFLLLLIISFLQPPLKIQYSLFTIILKTPIFISIGQCSLAIYTFHWILIAFYYNNAIIAIQNHYHGSPYTRKFENIYNPNGNLQFKNGIYCLLAFIISILFGIFMQRFIQEKLVPMLLSYIEKLYKSCFKDNNKRYTVSTKN